MLALAVYFQGDIHLRGTNIALFRGDIFKYNNFISYFPAFKQVKCLAVMINVSV